MATKKIMIILEAGSIPPEWIHLLPMGELMLADTRGPIQVDQQALDNVIAAGQRRGNDLVIDYEHQTLSGGEAPAAGWIKEMQGRPDGLWARVEWTDKATAYITSREYRYFSPVLVLDEERRPTALLNAGLTNFPAITHLPPLVAKSREGMEVIAMTTQPDKIEKGIHSQAQASGIKTQEDKSMPMQQMKGILGLTAEAQETEVLTAVQHMVQQEATLKSAITSALGLKADVKPEEITGAITALKGDQGKLATLETEVAALKDKEAIRAAEGLVEEALKAGKLIPAERDLAVDDAKRDAEGFKARMAVRPKVVPLRDNLGVHKPEKGGADEPGPESPVDRRISFKAQKLAAEKNLDLAAAQAQVLKDNPELAREYKQSFSVGA